MIAILHDKKKHAEKWCPAPGEVEDEQVEVKVKCLMCMTMYSNGVMEEEMELVNF